jgi:hypothetical protein
MHDKVLLCASRHYLSDSDGSSSRAGFDSGQAIVERHGACLIPGSPLFILAG